MAADSLAGALRELAADGFDGDLRVAAPGVICGTCRSVSRPGDLLVQRLRRLEGASDPDDLLIVVGATCRGCGTDGALVLGYGPGADPDHAMVLAGLDVPEAVPAGAITA